ncbi:MAG: hypothetical protein KDK70_23110 [Myxococcales bacterium]|nr:hypothetical protein [Myxococcales bacterium]
MSLALLVGAAVAGGTYLYSKKKKASTGQSVAVGAATGTAAGAATALTLFVLSSLWPLVVVGGVVGGAYYVLGKKKGLKALPPSSSG